MPAAQVTELVRKSEPLARRRLRAVDPDQRATGRAPHAAGDVCWKLRNDDRDISVPLDCREHTRDGLGRIEPQRGACFPSAFGSRVGVLARHAVDGDAQHAEPQARWIVMKSAGSV